MPDRLDEQAEARIREACASGHEGYGAAILADREARAACPGCEAAIDDAAEKLRAERAHADALAEALVDAANEMHSYGLVADHWLHGKQVPLSECGYALCVAANEVLAAHDKLRGR